MKLLEKSGLWEQFNTWQQQAFDLLRTPQARKAFDLQAEPESVRERYGKNRFGQSVLLARRLVEAGVHFIQVNWTRIDGALNNGSWDTHEQNEKSLKNWLLPRIDQAYSALLEDLIARGMLHEILVVWAGEFGRTPKINARGGRDHWGNVFSLALAGGGVKAGYIHGSSDRLGAEPATGVVTAADYTATIYQALGLPPETKIYDLSGRGVHITNGHIVQEVFS